MRLRPLGGSEVLLRPSTSDVDTVWGTFAGRYHLPPPEAGEPRLIWDLGANIGLTMADLAVRHPGARVVGVELDSENAALARANVDPVADPAARSSRRRSGPRDEQLRYVRLAGATSGHYVTDAALEDDPAVTAATAISPASLLRAAGRARSWTTRRSTSRAPSRALLREETAWAGRVRTHQGRGARPVHGRGVPARPRGAGVSRPASTRASGPA